MQSAVAAYISSFDVAPPFIIDLVDVQEYEDWEPETDHAASRFLIQL